MIRWILPGVVVGVVAGTTLAATLAGPQPLPPTPFAASETWASVVCPAFESATASIRVAAASTGDQVRTAPVDDPADATDASGLRVVTASEGSLRVSAKLPEPFGATTVVAADNGADRGLSASACTSAGTGHWFTGVDIRSFAQSEVVVANLDGTTASVDLTVYGQDGRVPAPRGIEVSGNSVKTISLGTLERSAEPVSVEVSSSDGRFAAFLRQRTWDGDEPLGADWLDATTEPATDVVIPGVPSGAGGRLLVVTNPGDRTATATVGTLTTSGAGGVTGVEQFEVPAGTTRSVDLAAGLDGQAVALRVSSTQPVTAGLWLDGGGGTSRHDPAYTVGTRPLPADSLWPLALGKDATTLLQLANPTDTEAAATVVLGSGGDAGQPQEVKVPAGSIVEVPLTRAATNTVRVQTQASGLRGALVSRETLGKVRGLAVVDLAADDSISGVAPVVFDPHVGS